MNDMPSDLSQRLNLAVSLELLRRIDDWRRQHPRIPTRAEAARMLIEQALAANAAPAGAGNTTRASKK